MESPLSAKIVRIGGALGFWGDRHDALFDLLKGGPLDYVMMDYLAEVTMSILQKQRLKTPGLGYAHDFIPVIKKALPLLRAKRVRLIANAGGLDPLECARALARAAVEAGFPDLKIGVVSGDDLMPELPRLAAQGVRLDHFDSGASQDGIPSPVLSANAYLGAFPIAAALARGAEIVVTGRVNDAALVLGPLIHEFKWKDSDYDRLASGTIAGHLLECGGQASGGNFNGDWQKVPALERLGYPIAEVDETGDFTMTLHPGQGGLITPAVLKEQLLYEIGDPADYRVADVRCDLTALELEDLGQNRVRVRGARGGAPTADFKVSMTYAGGYKIAVGLIYTWPDCLAKARAGAALFLARLEKLGLLYQDHFVSILGHDGVHGPMSQKNSNPDEVYLRIAFRVADHETAERISREVASHIVSGIPTATGLDARPSPQKEVLFWPSRIAKALVSPVVTLLEASEKADPR